RRRHTRLQGDWSSDVCSSDLKIRQGVTTEVLGEDTSGGPAKGKRPQERLERDGKAFHWSTLGEYLDTLESAGIATNAASYVGLRSEERRVGKEWRSRGWPCH